MPCLYLIVQGNLALQLDLGVQGYLARLGWLRFFMQKKRNPTINPQRIAPTLPLFFIKQFHTLFLYPQILLQDKPIYENHLKTALHNFYL